MGVAAELLTSNNTVDFVNLWIQYYIYRDSTLIYCSACTDKCHQKKRAGTHRASNTSLEVRKGTSRQAWCMLETNLMARWDSNRTCNEQKYVCGDKRGRMYWKNACPAVRRMDSLCFAVVFQLKLKKNGFYRRIGILNAPQAPQWTVWRGIRGRFCHGSRSFVWNLWLDLKKTVTRHLWNLTELEELRECRKIPQARMKRLFLIWFKIIKVMFHLLEII